VFRSFPPWLGLVGAPIDHLDSASDQDLRGFPGIEKAVVGPEREGVVEVDQAEIPAARGGDQASLATAVEAFVGVRPAPQERCASLAAGRTDKPLRPTPLEQGTPHSSPRPESSSETLLAIAP